MVKKPAHECRIKARLYGTLRRFSNPDTPGTWAGTIPAHMNIRDFLRLLGTTPEEISSAVMNGEVCALETEIEDGAELILVTPVGGGSS